MAACVMLMPAGAVAQEFPTREIHTICPFAPGTGADIVVRYYANKLSELAGKPVITDNKPGRAGLARHRSRRARTQLTATRSRSIRCRRRLAASPHLFKKLSFDPLKDLDPVGAAPVGVVRAGGDAEQRDQLPSRN